MLKSSESSFTREQLFYDLKRDGIVVEAEEVNKARKGDGVSMCIIGLKYKQQKQKYDKAMAWYRLGAGENNSGAQNNIGILYHNGEGVPQDYLLALEWYLKSAVQNCKIACGNIGDYFENGHGVPVNKYMALRWYHKSGIKRDRVKELMAQGFHLTQHVKKQPIRHLIMETEDMLRSTIKKREEEWREENEALKQLTTRMKEESHAKDIKIKSFEESSQSYQLAAEQKQKAIEELKRVIQVMNGEIQSLKLMNSTQATQLEVKDLQINALKKEMTTLDIVPEGPMESMSKRINELEKSNRNLEKSNQNLERLFEQEKRMRDNEIALIKQEMQFLLNKKKQAKRDSEIW